eukprot:m.41932 g.41932  ORF g.41932 m.41932 type:complete len:67 (-) comp7030_c0_seq1:143-343(-)
MKRNKPNHKKKKQKTKTEKKKKKSNYRTQNVEHRHKLGSRRKWSNFWKQNGRRIPIFYLFTFSSNS